MTKPTAKIIWIKGEPAIEVVAITPDGNEYIEPMTIDNLREIEKRVWEEKRRRLIKKRIEWKKEK